jgi:hypothetical protein
MLRRFRETWDGHVECIQLAKDRDIITLKFSNERRF